MISSMHHNLFFAMLLFFQFNLVLSTNSIPRLPQLERSSTEDLNFIDSISSLFRKRDECGTQFGPTYVDCGSVGCFQPSLGEVCCGANSMYCPEGQFCAGNYCCPTGLTGACCIRGVGCPPDVSSYYSTSPSTAAPSTISSTSIEASSTSTTSAKTTTTSTFLAPTTTSVEVTSTSIFAIPTTTSAVTKSNSDSSISTVSTSKATNVAGTITSTSISTSVGTVATQTQSSGGVVHERRIKMGIFGFAIFLAGYI